MAGVHHFVPTFEPGAVGGHIVELQRLCRDLGWASDVYAEHRRYPDQEALDFRSYPRRARPGDVLVYHVAIGSAVADFVLDRPETLVVDHHNITPAAYFEGWDPAVAHGVAWGRRQLSALADRTSVGLADSAFNRAELDELGYRRTAVAPILFDPAGLGGEVDPAAAAALSADGPVWLFVSRFAPNKCQHDLVKAFAVYRRVYAPDAVLRLVGRSSDGPYVEAVRDLVLSLGLGDAVELLGGVDHATLGAHYRAADVYVTVSRHEGFSVTPLEAMHHGLPVVAFAGGAVPETVGAAALCLERADPGTVAAAVDRVVGDAGLRAALVAAGHRRLADFSLEASRQVMAGHLQPVVEDAR